MGVAFGSGVYLLGERIPKNRGAQVTYGATAIALFSAAWLVTLAA